jgi:type II secretory pathway component PulF
MHTIAMVRRTLGLSSDNQVRNRIEQIKDLLRSHTRRGPNNQIFLTDEGLDLLKQLQELYDSGLTLTEASQVIRSKAYKDENKEDADAQRLAQNQTKPTRAPDALVSAVREEMAAIHESLTVLERRLRSEEGLRSKVKEPTPWWVHLREDVDVP